MHTVIDDDRRVAYDELHDVEKAVTASDILDRAVAWFADRGSPSSGSCPTTARPTNRICGTTDGADLGITMKKTRSYRPARSGV